MTDIQMRATLDDLYKNCCLALRYGEAKSCVILCDEKFFKELRDFIVDHLVIGLVSCGRTYKLFGIELIPLPDYLFRYRCPYRLITDYNVTKIMEDKLGGRNNG